MPHSPDAAPRRPLSRPARLQALGAEARRLQAEYEHWLGALPDAFADGDLADRLNDTIEQLGDVADLLDAIEPPKGFGRD